MASLTYWQSREFLSLKIEEWEDGFTVFQPASGMTHFLNPLSMQILAELRDTGGRAVSDNDLCESLGTKFDLIPDPTFVRQVQKLLCRFDELGLVEKMVGK